LKDVPHVFFLACVCVRVCVWACARLRLSGWFLWTKIGTWMKSDAYQTE